MWPQILRGGELRAARFARSRDSLPPVRQRPMIVAMPSSRTGREDLQQRTLRDVIHACDLIFGSTTAGLALVGTWLLVIGRAQPATVVALWLIVGLNLAWSALTKGRNPVLADLARAAMCLPIASFLYVADHGPLEQMWIPSLLLSVGPGLSLGIATRRCALGYLVSATYSGSLLAVAAARFGSLDASFIDDALGILVVGCIITLVGSRLGRTLDEARRQRDDAESQRHRAEATLEQLTARSCELTTAIESLHHEMEHRVRVEGELHQAQKLESMGRLAAGVAHEINTPIQFVSDSVEFVRTAVKDLFEAVDQYEVARRAIAAGATPQMAFTNAIEASQLEDLPYLREQVPKALERAIDGVQRVATIVRSMKEFAHPDQTEMVAADLNRAIQSTLTMARNEYKYVADLETDFGELPPIACHLGELNQAVLNIVVNAAQAIGEVVQGTDRRGRIRVTTTRGEDEVLITIADTGGGIPEKIRGQVFDPFFTTKKVGLGTGQGLAIAHAVIVDKHHGKLTFESKPGQGTTFLIRLPIATPATSLN